MGDAAGAAAEAGAKAKGKFKGKTLGLEDFLEKPLPKFDWAAEMEAETARQEEEAAVKAKILEGRSSLPSGPRGGETNPSTGLPAVPALRCLVSLADVPDQPPFLARLSNVSYDADELAIRDFFANELNVPLRDVKIPRDRVTGQNRGFVFLKLASKEELIKALHCSGAQLFNRELRVEVADQDRNRDMASPPPGGLPPSSPPHSQGHGHPPQRQRQDVRDYAPPPPRHDRGPHGPPQHQRYDQRDQRHDRYDQRDHRQGYDQGYHGPPPPHFQQNSHGGGQRGPRGPPHHNNYMGGGGPPGYYGGGPPQGPYGPHGQQPGRVGGQRHSADAAPPHAQGPGPQEPPKERPKLQLLPRSNSEQNDAPKEPTKAASIFGQAKPVDTAAKEAEIERKMAEEKAKTQRPLKVETRRRTSERTTSGSSFPSSPPISAGLSGPPLPPLAPAPGPGAVPPVSPKVEPSEQTLAPGGGRGRGRGVAADRGRGGRGRGRGAKHPPSTKAPGKDSTKDSVKAPKPKAPVKPSNSNASKDGGGEKEGAEEKPKKEPRPPRPPKEMPKVSNSPPPSFSAKNPFDLLAELGDD